MPGGRGGEGTEGEKGVKNSKLTGGGVPPNEWVGPDPRGSWWLCIYAKQAKYDTLNRNL